MLLQISMPSAGEWLMFIVLPFIVLFFVFKAGQWYGEAKERKRK